jgi:hypothetical protein
MVCRCREVEECGNDIRVLERELGQELSTAQRNGGLESQIVTSLGRDLTRAAYVENIARIETRLAAIIKQRDGHFNNLQSRRSTKLSKVLSKRSNFESEDRRHHETQGKK